MVAVKRRGCYHASFSHVFHPLDIIMHEQYEKHFCSYHRKFRSMVANYRETLLCSHNSTSLYCQQKELGKQKTRVSMYFMHYDMPKTTCRSCSEKINAIHSSSHYQVWETLVRKSVMNSVVKEYSIKNLKILLHPCSWKHFLVT